MSKDNGNGNDELVFNMGDTVAGFELIKKIDEGGFGQVFKVSKDNQIAAMKIESNSQEGGSAIKLEMNVLRQLKNDFVFPRLIAGGRRVRYHYLVLELLGDNLKMLKARSHTPEAWTDGTWSRIAIQCLYALKTMHDKGFVHRDVKPSNFAIGQNSLSEICSRRIFLFDFGLARRFVKTETRIVKIPIPEPTKNQSTTNATNPTKQTTEAKTKKEKTGSQIKKQNRTIILKVVDRMRNPQKTKEATVEEDVKGDDKKEAKMEKEVEEDEFRIARPHTDFRGTHQYASPNAHAQIELGRHDDIWSLMYMIAEMFVDLPWASNDDVPVERLKDQYSLLRIFSDPKNPDRFTAEMRGKLTEIDKKLREYHYYSHPDYDLVHKFFESVMIKSHVTWQMPYDWENAEELAVGLAKLKAEDKGTGKLVPWENPGNFFKEDKWAKLKAPSRKPVKHPVNKPSNPPARNNKKPNRRENNGYSKEDSQAGDEELPVTPKSGKDGKGRSAEPVKR